MKKLLVIVGICLLQYCASPYYIPTPKKSMSFFVMEDSLYKWEVRNQSAAPAGFLNEATREHESLNNWTELYVQQILFTDLSLNQFLNGWFRLMKNQDANATFEKKEIQQNKILVKYNFGGEYGIYLCMKEQDGIYQNGWATKVTPLDSARVKYIERKLLESELFDNPYAK